FVPFILQEIRKIIFGGEEAARTGRKREKCPYFTGLLRPQGIPLSLTLERYAPPANGRIYHLRDRVQEDLLDAEGLEIEVVGRCSGAEQLRGRRLTADQVQRRRRTARELDLGQYLPKGYHGPWWTKAEVAMLGRLPDEEVARRTGRTADAVRHKREKRASEKRASCK